MLAIAALLLGLAGAAAAPADTARASVQVSVLPKPEAFYSPSRGLGAGVDVTLRRNAQTLHASAATMTRYGEYSAFLFSADPLEAALHGGAGIRYVGTRAYSFYGLGPRSQRDDRIRFTARRIELEARAGWRPFAPTPLTVQPSVRLLHDRMRAFEEIEDGALARLDEASQASILRAIEGPSTGVVASLALVADLLDDPHHPRSGGLFQVSGSRYFGIDADPFGYVQTSAIAHGVLPIVGDRTVLEARAISVVTRPVGPERPIPFFALPTLDGELVGGFTRYRLVGRDLLALSAGVRFPVLDLFGWIGAEGFVAVHLANAYDDVFSQFEPRVSFASQLGRDGDRAPLRPALTLGGHLVDLGKGRPVVSGQVGFSPEGFELAGLDFVVDLRTRRPPVR